MQNEKPFPLHVRDLSEQTQTHSLQEKGKNELRSLAPIVKNFLV